MDSEQERKLFIGGISWKTTEERLKDYFSAYGDVLSAVIMCDKVTGLSRGFGFVVFAEPSVLDRVLQDKHSIDGRIVEAKRALSREEQLTTTRSAGDGSGGAHNSTKRIFVGGLPSNITEGGFRRHFESYGPVDNSCLMYDSNTLRPRGFDFITFASEDTVDQVLQKTFHNLGGKRVEVKRALPKDAAVVNHLEQDPINPNAGGGQSSGAGSYESYAGANANSGSKWIWIPKNKGGEKM